MNKPGLTEAPICPWCDTEIIWDPEIGPENECPHCANELSNYRTVGLSLGAHASQGSTASAEAILPELDEDLGETDPHAMEETVRFNARIDQLLDSQEEAVDCPKCLEPMVYAGKQLVTSEQFVPAAGKNGDTVFLSAPFSLQLFICPSCFHAEHSLSEQDREQLWHRLTQD